MRFHLEPARDKLSANEVLDISLMARGFVEHPYWRRVSTMLANTEKAELETLLDPTSPPEAQALSRASVAMIRKLLAMPHVDIAQGDAALKAIERHSERFGVPNAHHSAEKGQ